VLEGGQTKEEEKRKEIFFNEIFADDEINRMFDPKVLTNFTRYTTASKQPVIEIKRDENGFIRENLIVKGNNLIALHSLKNQIRGKVKLIYIDPPYNTGNDSFGYNDNFNHSSWLTFMKNRLEIAYKILCSDGSIWINIDDDESHYLKILCDEVFGRNNFIANVIWQKKYSPQNDAKYFSDMHDHILIFSKNKDLWKRNLIPRTQEMNKRYSNPDNDPRGPWKSSDFSVKTYSSDYDYPIKTPSGRVVNPPKSRCWRTSKENFQKLIDENRIWFGTDGSAVPSIKRFLSEVQNGTPPQTIWHYSEVGHNQDARREIVELFKNDELDFGTPKPEKLLERIIHIGSNEGDLILDFFAGSGTTGSVALKMNRQVILCEQINMHAEFCKERLYKVILGDNSKLSKEINWIGGSDFIYCELMKYNEVFMEHIQGAQNSKELLQIWQEISENSFLNWYVNPQIPEEAVNDFIAIGQEENGLDKQKKLLAELLDKNQLYVNLSEINDRKFNVSDEDKALNKAFYGEI